MKKIQILCAVVGVVLTLNSSVWGEDYNPPPWRGEDNTTTQIWEFSTDANPSQPDSHVNPNGTATLTVEGDFLSTAWLPEYKGHQGVWKFKDFTKVDIPNYQLLNPHKEIWMQLTFATDRGAGVNPVIITVPASTGAPVLIDKQQINDYYRASYSLTIKPNPEFESIYIQPRDCTMFLDELVIDTICVQEVESCFAVNELKIAARDAKCKGITLLEVTSDQGVLVYEPEPGRDKLKANTVVDDGVNGAVTIHSSCSKPLDIGDVFGAYTVTDLVKILGDDGRKKGNEVGIKGSFNPAVPIDLAVDEVILFIDDGQGHVLVFSIPAGSFKADGKPENQKYKFDSPKGSGPDIKAKFDFPKCQFELSAKAVPNTDEITGTTLTVGVQVGANFKEEVLQAQVEGKYLEYKRSPKQICCPKCKGITLLQVTSDQGVFVFEPAPGKGKLKANTVVDDGVNGPVTIHTSCSKPLDIGDVFGPYTVTDLVKIFDSPKPKKCKGVTLLEVTSDQGVFVFKPAPGKGKLKANTVVDDGVNGAVTIHTSCSKPLDIGDVFGAYTVTNLVKILE